MVTDLGDQNQRLGKQLAEAEEAALDLRAQVACLDVDLRELRSCCVDVDLAVVVDEWLGKLVEAAHDLRAQVFNLYLVLIMWNLWWIWLVW